MAPPLLSLKNARLSLGNTTLFDFEDLTIYPNDRIALVGRNGSGKSTLMKVLAQQVDLDAGELFIQPGTKVAYLPQDPDFSEFQTLFDYVLAELPVSQRDEKHRAEKLLHDLSVDGNANPNEVSGGQARRASLARTLVNTPDLLLLDEPTNHLDVTTIRWLERFLFQNGKAFMSISHDRAFLKATSDKTFWLERAKLHSLPQGYEHFEEWSQTLLEQEEVRAHKLNKKIKEESQWAVQGISARRKRNQGRLRRLYDLRDEQRQTEKKQGTAALSLNSGAVSGKKVIEALNVSKSYGQHPIINDFSIRLQRGDRVGIVGANGTGKTTLIKMLCGDITPDEGEIIRGTNLVATYIDQKREQLDREKTLWETLADMGGDQILVQGQPRHVLGYLKDFLFDESRARSPVSSLSGGELNRLFLAKSLARATNFLILDEPTNDLDLETLELLQEVICDYDGTVLLVSHDREFLDQIVMSTLFLDGSGTVEHYPGGYSDALAAQKRTAKKAQKENNLLNPKTKKKGSKSSSIEPLPNNNVQKRKLSYNEQRDLEILPKKLEELENQMLELEQKLSNPDLYQKDPDLFAQTTEILSALHQEKETTEERWLELELLKETL